MEVLVQLPLCLDDLSALKSDLRRIHLTTAATRRTEGAARGLGFGSYAALRSALQGGPRVVRPDDQVFADYISYQPEEGKGPRSLSRAIARIAVRRVIERQPRLTECGFDSPYRRLVGDGKITPAERRAAFDTRREATLSDYNMDEFELAWIYLSMQGRRKTINFDFGSYGLKHRAENLSRKYGMHEHLGNYVSNGMFIIAALASGFEAKQIDYDLNACFNISSKTIRATAGHPVMTRREQGRMLGLALASIDAEPAWH
jgi:hypothetical protein